jgi:putative ABC transport system permease protein
MSYVSLDAVDLAIAFGLMLIAIGLAHVERVGYTKTFLIGTIRTVAQLLAIGFVLRGVFEVSAWWLNLVVLTVMISVATLNAVRRQDHKTPGYFRIAATALALGPLTVTAGVVYLVVRDDSAQYVIPLGGMIIAYAMNTLTLFKNRFDSEVRTRRGEIEAKLALGATARRAAEDVVRQAFRAALLPTINFMMVVGLVQIPGMMGGQIIGGADPLDAALYQILVAFQLAGAAVISCFIVSRLVFRATFNRDHQLLA